MVNIFPSIAIGNTEVVRRDLKDNRLDVSHKLVLVEESSIRNAVQSTLNLDINCLSFLIQHCKRLVEVSIKSHADKSK